ncbi:MAG: hypothetical protein ACJ8M1_03860 [Chthoniobacterales bacterium]
MIAITFALPAESSELVRKMGDKHANPTTGAGLLRLEGQDIAVCHTGVGRGHCRRALNSFLSGVRPEFLISSGFAGSLSPTLNVGDVFLARNYSDPRLTTRMEGGAPAPPPDPGVRLGPGSRKVAPSSDRLRFHWGTILTIDAIAHSREERERLAQQHQADAVDMETDVIAEICRARAIPMLSLRVISDSPADPFPAPPDVLFDVARQQTNFGTLIPYLLGHPSAMMGLMKFAKRIKNVRAILADTLVEIVGLLPKG